MHRPLRRPLALALALALAGPAAAQPGPPLTLQPRGLLGQLAGLLADLGLVDELAAARLRLGLTDALTEACGAAAEPCPQAAAPGCHAAALQALLSCAHAAGLTDASDQVFRATAPTADGGQLTLYGTLGAPLGRPALRQLARAVEGR